MLRVADAVCSILTRRLRSIRLSGTSQVASSSSYEGNFTKRSFDGLADTSRFRSVERWRISDDPPRTKKRTQSSTQESTPNNLIQHDDILLFALRSLSGCIPSQLPLRHQWMVVPEARETLIVAYSVASVAAYREPAGRQTSWSLWCLTAPVRCQRGLLRLGGVMHDSGVEIRHFGFRPGGRRGGCRRKAYKGAD